MKVQTYVLQIVLIILLTQVHVVLSQSKACLDDLTAMRNREYYKGEVLKDATGQGNYGYFSPLHGYFDPGKWTVCERAKDHTPAEYCYMYLQEKRETDNLIVGACVPGSCTADDLNKLGQTKQGSLILVESLRLPNVFIEGVHADCTGANYDYPAGFYIFIVIFSILVVLMFVGTLIDIQLTYKLITFKSRSKLPDFDEDEDGIDDEFNDQLISKSAESSKPKGNQKLEEKHPNIFIKLIVSFSLIYNTGRLFAPSPPGSFEVLNGVRVVAMAFVVFGHTFFFMWDTMAIINAEEIYYVVRTFRFQIAFAGFYAVDTFFFLSGFLVAYLFIKELRERGITGKVMFMYYFHRIYRLTPALAAGVFFYWLITPYWNNGPYWKFYQFFVNTSCENSWWWSLLYLQNIVDSHICMGWSWYLADDMQYYLLSPIILILYLKHRAAAWIFCIVAILVCISSNIGIAARNDIQEFGGLELAAELGNYIPSTSPVSFGGAIYIPPWTRFAPYLIGFICAFILLEKGVSFRITPLYRTIIYISSCSIIFILSFITYFDANYGWEEWMNIVWIGFSRTFWSIGLGALLITCIVGYGGAFTHIMSSTVWIPFARLSYSAYIFHLSNIATIYAGYKSGLTYYFAQGIYFFIGHLIIAFLYGYMSYILVEKPLMNIETILLSRGSRSKKN